MDELRTAAPRGRQAANPSTRLPRARVDVHGRVAVLRLDSPAPGAWNALHAAEFIEDLRRISADSEREAVVLHGQLFEDPGFPQGLAPGGIFSDVLAAVAACRIPVVAAISGRAAGAGLELALACAGRVAGPGATFAFPGVLAGRLPVNGGFERLPRLIGMDAAARLLVFGQTFDAATATEVGLVDAVASRNLAAFAASFAASDLVGARRAPPRAVEPEVAEAQLYRVRVSLRHAPDQDAPLAALRALEAATRLPTSRARDEIRRIADDFARSAPGRALAYAEEGALRLAKRGAIEQLEARLHWAMLREAVHLLDEGASPCQVDRCLMSYGFAEGPFARSDRLGLAVVFTRGGGLASSDDWQSYSATLDLMADAGRTGGPGAQGWFRRPGDGRTASFDPAVDQLLQASATFQRLHRAPMTDEVVVQRCLYAAINGVAAALDEDSGLSASQADAVWTGRLGFPRWKGGPLFQAETIGLPLVVETLDRWRQRRNTAGAPSAVLVRLAARAAPS